MLTDTTQQDATQTSDPTPDEAKAAALALLYAPIKDELAQVEQLLKDELQSEQASIDEMLRYGVMLGGKRLRPALVLLAAKAAGEIRPDHIVLGTVVEMIHTATLIHDDVLDEADMRRHLATANHTWDNEASVLLGDFLFTHAFYLASTLDSTLACRIIGSATNTVCEGELRQVRSRGNFNLTEQQYFEIIQGKTAALCECCCQLGAQFSGADAATVKALREYGRLLGMAFQIADDVLDVVGDPNVTGKSIGTDLDKQKMTLPVIHALANSDEATRAAIIATIKNSSPENGQPLQDLLSEHDSIGYARRTAAENARAAGEHLAVLPDSPSKQVLQQIAAYVVMRSS